MSRIFALKNKIHGNKAAILQLLFALMFLINLLVLAFLTLTIYRTTLEICRDFEARAFLESAKYLPLVPWKVPVYALLLLGCLFISHLLKTIYAAKKQGLVWLLVLVDIGVSVYLAYLVNFSYRGLFLLLIISVFLYVPSVKSKVLLLVAVLVAYIIMDNDLLSIGIKVVSLQTYLNYYPAQMRFTLYAVKNIMESINLIVVILFFTVLVQEKISETKEYIWVNNELKDKLAELKQANEMLEVYAEESVALAKTKERNRLAREIHDVLGHSLTNIATGVEACLELVEVNLPLAKGQLEKIRSVALKGLVDVRRSVRELKIDAIEKYNMIPAVEALIRELNQLSDTKISLRVEGEVLKLQDDEEQTIYRVIQESLTNSLRHSGAKEIWVKISFGYQEIRLVIRDNGQGCYHRKKGFGLTHMEERIQLLGGSIDFSSQMGKGFETVVFIPIRWGKAYD